jgi:hypothetical protein
MVKNTKSVSRRVTVRLVLARWPEKPWLHENRNIRRAASERPLQLAATFSPCNIFFQALGGTFGRVDPYYNRVY